MKIGGAFFMDKERKINGIDKNENEEDVTKYGEFVTTYFAWVTPERQKRRANELNEMTKKDDNKENKK